MTKNQVEDLYFDWIYESVADNEYFDSLPYRKLLKKLEDIPFSYSIPQDGNRVADAIELRYHFGYENDIDERIIACYLDDRPCNVLEVMTALAIRCENDIMNDPDIGDRTGEWFWSMLVNLGLDGMDDESFDEEYVEEVVYRFLDRDYDRDGKGGLFYIKGCTRDLRNVEIWMQMNWYLNQII